jgi:hypothetical protein
MIAAIFFVKQKDDGIYFNDQIVFTKEELELFKYRIVNKNDSDSKLDCLVISCDKFTM